MKAPALIYGIYTDRGKREENQDAFLLSDSEQVWTFGVADGIGGYKYGKEAAKMALETIDAELKSYGGCDSKYIYYLLLKKYEQINEYIYKLGQSMSVYMGTTMALLNFIGERYLLSNAGDTKIYLIRDGAIKTISQIHNVAAEEYERGTITYEEYRNHKEKNVLTRCLGMSDSVKPYFMSDICKKGDIFIICTDGMYNFISDDNLLSAFTGRSDMQDECRKLGMEALKRGSDDNLTVLAVEVI